MGKKKRGKKKNGLKNIKTEEQSSESLDKSIIHKASDTHLLTNNYSDIQKSLNQNIGNDFSKIEQIFDKINTQLNTRSSCSWSTWIDL